MTRTLMMDGRVYRSMMAVLHDFEMDYEQHGKEWAKESSPGDIYFNDAERHRLGIKLTNCANLLLKDLANSYSRSSGAKKAAATMKRKREKRETEAQIEELSEGRR